MIRARRAALAAFVLAWLVASLSLTAAPASGSPPVGGQYAPAVAWPVSSGLLIAEVVTGGASASDEYIEITNAGQVSIDLNGLELAYASAAGTSAIRRAGWTSATLVGPGRHLLIANAGGAYAATADATYTAGIAATGGAVILRPAGGDPIDAVGWGAATNTFVETAAAPAPPAGSSIERGPGGSRGNVRDTNDNASDWSINASPLPENLAAPARPVPGASPGPSASPRVSPSPRPSPSPSPAPSASPRPTPSASPSPKPTPSASPRPSPSPTPAPSPSPVASPSPSPRPTPTPVASPTPAPTATPSPVLTPSPSPVPTPSPTSSGLSIAEAIRSGGTLTVEGVATTDLSLLDSSGRLLVIQDATAAIEVRLPVGGVAAVDNLAGRPLGPGDHLRVTGVIGRAYGAPRLSATAVIWLGNVNQPAPLRIGSAPGPGLEWRLVVVAGRLDAVHRLGQRWRADLIVAGARIPVMGLTGAQIAVTRLLPGRRVTIIGIVRRAYPSAIDQRFAIDPRFVSDLLFQPAGPIRPTSSDEHGGSSGATDRGGPGDAGNPGAGPATSAVPIVDLAQLVARRGQPVRVGGLITRVDGEYVLLDDGTATGRLRLTGGAAAYLDLVQAGDPLEASGVVQVDGSGPYVLVTDPDGVVRTGDPGSSAPAGYPGTDQAGLPAVAASPADLAANGPAGGHAAAGGQTGTASIDPAQALALTLFGAATALLLALAISLFVARRGVRTGRPAGSVDEPRARPTLGPS